MALPMAAGLLGGGVSGGAGGIDLSGGPANSSATGGSDSGGAVFNFAPAEGVQKTQTISNTVALVVVALLVLWLMSRK